MSDVNERLPDGWVEITLDDLGDWKGGGTPSKSNSAFWTGGNVPWVSPKDMKKFYLDDSEDKVTNDAVRRSSAQLFPSDSVLVVTRSGILERTLPVAINRVPVATNQDLKTLIPSVGIDSRYVAYFLRGNDQHIREECAKAGTTVASIDLPKLKEYRCDLAPLAEQRRIVKKIEDLHEHGRNAREALTEVGPLLEQFRKSLLAAAFRGDLTADWRAANPDVEPASQMVSRIPRPPIPPRAKKASIAKIKGDCGLSVGLTDMPIPETWEWTPLTRLGQLVTGHTPSRTHPEYWDGEIAWIGIKDARNNNGRIIEDTLQHVTQLGIENSASRMLPKGTVLMTRTANSIGYSVVLGRDMATSQPLNSDKLDSEPSLRQMWNQLVAIRDRIEPTNNIVRSQWLFGHDVVIPGVDQVENFDEYLAQLNVLRTNAIQLISSESSWTGIRELASLAQDVHTIGWISILLLSIEHRRSRDGTTSKPRACRLRQPYQWFGKKL